MEWLILPLSLLGLAFLYRGFPSLITINKYYGCCGKDDEDDD